MSAPKVKYRIDLREAFDKAFLNDGPIKRSLLRPFISEVEVKREIGRQIIDRIIDRTQKLSVDKSNNKFPGYSKSYKKSLAYEVYDKTSRVNLTLSGEMMASMIQKTDAKFYIDIVMADKYNNDKAHGNITGSYGKPSGDNAKARDFLGLPEKDLSKIIRTVITDASGSRIALNIGTLASALREQGATKVNILPRGAAANLGDLLTEGFEID